MAVLGLHCYAGFYLVAVSGATLVMVCRLFICSSFSCCGAQALECLGFSNCGSQASLPLACGILLDQELNPCLLHWQVDPTTEPPGKAQVHS